jgi:hypothetical protein
MSRVIINLAGKKRTGKETAYRLILPYVDNPEEFQFATPLKKFCIEVLGLTEAQCYGSSNDRETPTKYKWGFVAEDIRLKYDKRPEETMSARSVLQVIGTDLMRDKFYRDIWAYAGIRAAASSTAETCIFTDTRFINEIDATLDVGSIDQTFRSSIIIRLYRQTDYNDAHESETALDSLDLIPNQRKITEDQHSLLKENDYLQVLPTLWQATRQKRKFDYLIDNNAGIDSLRNNMLYILKEHNIFIEPSGS